ncbi:unnamed protein product [Periconia digitata]|uniref:Uncharacterized protein n=1 Tax=Periconia digitata TaxID=1303443 RepID=A0A9W4XF03_9PLEO|nr:unnamed protein product [Periconia digitata]
MSKVRSATPFSSDPSNSLGVVPIVTKTWMGTALSDLGWGAPALTTVFTPKPECSTRWLYYTGASMVYSNVNDNLGLPSIRNEFFRICNPFGTQATTYSPGLCPSGMEFNVMTVNTQTLSQIWEGHCCPRGWNAYSSGVCSTIFTTPWTAIFGYQISGYIKSNDTSFNSSRSVNSSFVVSSTMISDAKTVTRETVLPRGTAFAAKLTVMWQSKDLSLFPTEYASVLGKRMGVPFSNSIPPLPNATASSIQSTPTVTTAGPPSPLPSASGSSLQPTVTETMTSTRPPKPQPSSIKSPQPPMSVAAKTGIGVATTLTVIFLCAIIVVALRRRRNKRVKPRESNNDQRIVLSVEDFGFKAEADSAAEINEADGDAAVIAEVSGCAAGFRRFWKGNWRTETPKDQLRIHEIDSQTVIIVPESPVELE